MARALLLPLIEQGKFLPENIFGVVGQEASVSQSLSRLPKGVKVVSSNQQEALNVWRAPIQLLAVKPQNLDSVALKAAAAKDDFDLETKPLLVSLLAGVTVRQLQLAFPNHLCVRAVVNTPALVKAGLTALSWGEGLTNERRLLVRTLFDPISEVWELSEDRLDAFLALTSSGPAYVALIVEALADGAVASGLTRELSYDLAVKTLSGTSLLLNKQNLHPGELKDMVASPAGTTIAALRHLEKRGLRSALMEAVLIAAERSREMSSRLE